MSLFSRLLTAVNALFLATSVQASINGGISLNQTRVIFEEGEKAQTLKVTNTSDRPFLIQSRAVMTPGGSTSAPFLVTPPLLTLAPGDRQTLRILQQGKPAQQQQESLFYLSVLAIPAGSKPQDADANMSVAMRFGLKLFYRPTNMGPMSDEQQCSLAFNHQAGKLEIKNPTPYFQTLGKLMTGSTAITRERQFSMIAPGGSLVLPIASAVNEVHWQIINDYGALSSTCSQRLPR